MQIIFLFYANKVVRAVALQVIYWSIVSLCMQCKKRSKIAENQAEDEIKCHK
jgi:hypothetical protein